MPKADTHSWLAIIIIIIIIIIMCTQDFHYIECEDKCGVDWYWKRSDAEPCEAVRARFPEHPERRIGFCGKWVEGRKYRYRNGSRCNDCRVKRLREEIKASKAAAKKK